MTSSPHKQETTTYTLPASWGSALVNGDFSGLSKEEILELKEFMGSFTHIGDALSMDNIVPYGKNDWNDTMGETADFTFTVKGVQ